MARLFTTTTVALLALAAQLAVAQSASSTWEYRLAGPYASPFYGRLEARPNASAAWGTVCDDFFGSSDAIVGCRSLGLGTAGARWETAGLSSPMKGLWPQPIVMDDVQCSGTEASLDTCTYRASHNCGHREDVVLTCPSATPAPNQLTWEFRLADGLNATYGRLEVRPNATAGWGAICGSVYGLPGWDYSNTITACRSLGFDGLSYATTGFRSTNVGWESRALQRYAFVWSCFGDEHSLEQCGHVAKSDPCSSVLLVSCGTQGVPTLREPDPWEYRLVGGDGTYGRLEVRPNVSAAWGTVCNDQFSSTDARIACASLGFQTTSSAQARRVRSPAEWGTGPIYMDDVICSYSTTTNSRLDLCSYRAEHNCKHHEDVVLTCRYMPSIPMLSNLTTNVTGNATNATYTPPSTLTLRSYDYRLVLPEGFTSNQSGWGRLEVRPRGDTASAWGSVCSRTWSTRAKFAVARVACRSLGYDNASGTSYRDAVQSEYTIGVARMADVECHDGTEDLLGWCDHKAYPHATCSPSNPLILSCTSYSVPYPTVMQYRLVDSTGADVTATQNWGRAMIKRNSSAPWENVCYSVMLSSSARSAFCRSLGKTSYPSWSRRPYAQERGGGWGAFGGFGVCRGDQPFAFCDIGNAGSGVCNESDVAVISCGSSTVPYPQPAWEYRLAQFSTEYGTTDASWGRLERRQNASSAWLGMCAHTFTRQDRQVACLSLGLPSWPVAGRALRSPEPAAGALLDLDLQCEHGEPALEFCPSTPDYSTLPCTTADAVVLRCGMDWLPSPPSTWEARLAINGTDGNTTWGRLEIRRNTNASWRTKCSADVGFTDAQVACRQLGLPTDQVGYRRVAPSERGDQLVDSTRLECRGSESNLGDCVTDGDAFCHGHVNDIMLVCGASTVPYDDPWQYRLVGGANNSYGRLEIRTNGTTWGQVCSSYFGYNEAAAACRSLGFNISGRVYDYYGARIASFGDEFASDSAVAVSSPSCSFAEGFFGQCSFSTDTSSCTWSYWNPRGHVILACGLDYVATNYGSSSAIPRLQPAWEYRLVGGNASFGRLESRRTNTSSWGTVCGGPSFDVAAAIVACRALNFTAFNATGVVRYDQRRRANSSLPVGLRALYAHEAIGMTPVLRNVACGGTETRLDRCAREQVPVEATMCPAGHGPVAVSCSGWAVPPLLDYSTAAPPVTTVPVTTAAPTVPVTTAAPNTTTTAPISPMPTPNSTTAPLPDGFVSALRSTIRIVGSAFGQLLNDPTQRALLASAVRSDLSGLLGVLQRYIMILDMYEGSLVVDFAVNASAGVVPETLSQSLAQASAGSDWLSSIQGVYQEVSNETLTAEVVSVNTAAPGVVTPPPSTLNTTGSSASVTSVWFSVAVSAAVVALVTLA